MVLFIRICPIMYIMLNRKYKETEYALLPFYFLYTKN